MGKSNNLKSNNLRRSKHSKPPALRRLVARCLLLLLVLFFVAAGYITGLLPDFFVFENIFYDKEVSSVTEKNNLQDAGDATGKSLTAEGKTQAVEEDVSVGGSKGNGKETNESYLVCIDPGHQAEANHSPEPIGPGSTQTKPSVSRGTRGVSTGVYEYELVLEVSLKLKERFQENGYRVIMTRETHEVDISNKERAIMANEAGADVHLRIHADYYPDPSVQGISVLYPGLDNAYLEKGLAKESLDLGELVMEEMLFSTGAKKRGLFPRNDITGFNWSEVPVILVELGFMSHPREDEKMSREDYQDKLITGIFKGVESYLK